MTMYLFHEIGSWLCFIASVIVLLREGQSTTFWVLLLGSMTFGSKAEIEKIKGRLR